MSFGFSVNDFLAVGKLCWKTYKRCKESIGAYAELSGEVSGLCAVIKETEELLEQQELTDTQKERLLRCQKSCEKLLEDLNALLSRYQSLGTKSWRTFDRLGFGSQSLSGIRQRVITNVTILDAFNNATSNLRLEQKLNLLISEVRAGKREGSIISEEDFDVKAHQDQETWDKLRRELEDIGISADVIEEKWDFILGWFQNAKAVGWLEEDVSPASDEDPITEGAISGPPAKHLHKAASTMSMAQREEQRVWSSQFMSIYSPSRRQKVDKTSAEGDHSPISGYNAEATKQDAQDKMSKTLGTEHNPQVDLCDQSIRNTTLGHYTNISTTVKQTSNPSAGPESPRFESSMLEDSLRPTTQGLSHSPPRTNKPRTRISPTVRRSNEEEDAAHVHGAGARDEGLLQYFITKGADPIAVDRFDETIRDHARFCSNDRTGILIDREQTPLMIACGSRKRAPNRHVGVAVFLLEHAADAEISKNPKPGTMFAAVYGGLTILNALLPRGVDVDHAAENTRYAAPTLAAHVGKELVMRFLVIYGVDVNNIFFDAANDVRYTSLSPPAADAGTTPLVRILVKNGAFVDSTVYELETDNSRLLIELGYEANRLTGEKGETPLMRAAKKWDVPAVQSLLRLGVNVKTTSRFGETALVLLMTETSKALCKRERTANAIAIMRFLVNAGASLTEGDRSGKKAWQIAKQSGEKFLPRDQFERYRSLMNAVDHYKRISERSR